jgi:hypothetical protein
VLWPGAAGQRTGGVRRLQGHGGGFGAPAASGAEGHPLGITTAVTSADIGRQHRSPDWSSADEGGGGQTGRRWRAAVGAPPRADSGSALARNWQSRDAARVPQAGQRPAEGARSRGGQAARILERWRDRSAGRYDPQANGSGSRCAEPEPAAQRVTAAPPH